MSEPVYMPLPPELRGNPSEDEMWLKRELDRIDPARNEMGNAGDGEALRKLVLADAVIRIFDLAGAYGMDLGGAIAEKLAFNQSRPDHKLAARMADGGKAY